MPRTLGLVDDLFAPPDTAWQPVSPALARMRRTLLAVATLLVLLYNGANFLLSRDTLLQDD